MSVYMTEAEQIAVIKQWWQRYSTMIIVAFSIVLFMLSGYRYWQWHQEKIELKASNAYEHLMLSFSNQDQKSVYAYANELIKNNGTSIYADAARLILARLMIEHEKYNQAKETLNQVAKHSKMAALKNVATIRMARLLLLEKSYSKALKILTNVVDEAYLPLVYELRGDIYRAMGSYPDAAKAYQKAMIDAKAQGMSNLFLEMKAGELSALT